MSIVRFYIQYYGGEGNGWTASIGFGIFRAMPSPAKNRSDRFADYDLRIRCKKCGHEGTADSHALAKLLGWETPLTTAAAKLGNMSATDSANTPQRIVGTLRGR